MAHKNRRFLPPGFVRAFTLLEVLAVVAIIAILAAVLIPGVKRGIESANAAKCISNLRQIGSANSLYAGEHNGITAAIDYWRNSPALREWRVWYTELEPYFNGQVPGQDILRCPSTKNGQTYSLNMQLCGFRLQQLNHPSQTIFLVEDTDGGWTSIRPSEGAPGGANPVQLRHNGKANFLFVDGHVSPMTYQETTTPENLWDPTR